MGVKVAIIGSGNIGTDLMMKVLRTSTQLEMGAFVGIDPDSDGLARARRLGVPVTSDGIDGLVQMPGFDEIAIVFDATSAGAHARHNAVLRGHSKQIIDLTPAAIGPYLVPAVNMHELADQPNVNMVTCGGQATIPIVAAISRVAPVPLRGDRRQHREPIGRAGNAREHRRVHADHGARHREGRRRPDGQGDHRPESRRAAADHAEYRVLSGRRRGCRGDRALRRADGRRRARVRAGISPETGRAVRGGVGRAPRARRRRRVHARASKCRCSSRSRAPVTTCRSTRATSTS